MHIIKMCKRIGGALASVNVPLASQAALAWRIKKVKKHLTTSTLCEIIYIRNKRVT